MRTHRAPGVSSEGRGRRAVVLRVVELTASAVAVIALGVAGTTWLVGRIGARLEIDRFTAVRAETRTPDNQPDFLLWSPTRIEAWRTAQKEAAVRPIGVLRIARLRVEAPILPGTDDATLNRAVGHIDGTPLPGAAGNSGLAGHRDSFFRALKDIAPGDAIELTTATGVLAYQVEQTWIVSPEDVWVLDPTTSPAITLVTCYPFYFIGSAPQRFIVRAVRSPDKVPAGTISSK